MTFDAFISYSHGGDAQVAAALERGLQRFAKPWYRRRALHVFRDSSSLSANPGLWSAITEAMDDSDFLVVCCSPESAASPWVEREIEHWIQTKGEGRILLALTAGELVWSDELGGFDPARSTAASAALAAAFVEEPLFVDMRWARNDDQLTLRNPRFKDQIAELAAPMHGVGKDALVGEEIRQHRRTLRVAGFAAAALIVLSGATVVSAVVAQRRADEVVRLNGDVAAKKRDIDAKTKQLQGLDDRLGRARGDLNGARRDLTQTQGENATLQGQVQSKTALADIAQQRADLLKGQADQSLLAANAADHSRDLAITDKNNAELASLAASRATTEAQARTTAAQAAQQDAEQKQKDAEAQREQALIDEANAVKKQNTATAAAGAAARDEEETRLGAVATQPDTVAGSLDLSLLLANAATQVPTSSNAANATANAMPDATATNTGPNAVARNALLTTVQNAGHARGFLRFNGVAPQALGQVAVSPDGKWVVAAEDSNQIQLGTARARVFLWGPDPAHDAAVTLPATFGCVVDLQWTANDELFSVDTHVDETHPFGCLTPKIEFTQGASYIGTRVLLWNPQAPLDAPVKIVGDHRGYSRGGRSPIALTANRQFTVVSFTSGFVLNGGRPKVRTMIVAADGHPKDAFNGAVGDLTGGATLSPSGRYVQGFDEDRGAAGTPALWDLQTFNPAVDCPADNVDEHNGCFDEITPLVNGTNDPGLLFTSGIQLSPDELHFWLGRIKPNDPHQIDVEVFDTATREQVGQTISLPAPFEIGDVALGNDWVEITRDTSTVLLVDWNDLSSTEVSPSGAAPGCLPDGRFSRDGQLLFLGWVCADTFADHTTVVSSTRSVLGQLEGSVVSSVDRRRVATTRLDLSGAAPHYSLEIWDLSGSSARLLGTRADERTVASDDGQVIVGFHAAVPGVADGSAEMWTTNSESSEPLPGSRGVRAVAFAGGHRFVGVGVLATGVEWDADSHPYDVLYDDDVTNPPAVCTDNFGDNRLRSALSPDGTRRAVTRNGHTIDIVLLSSGQVVKQLELNPNVIKDRFIADLAFSRSGRQLLVNVEKTDPNALQHQVCRFGIAVGSVVLQLAGPPGGETLLPEEAVTTSGDGTRVLMEKLTDHSVDVFDAATVRPVGKHIVTAALPGGVGSAVHYTLDQHGTRVAATNQSGNAMVWSIDGTVAVPAVQLAPGPVQPTANVSFVGLAFRPNGSQLAVKTADGRLFVHDLTHPGVRHVIELPTDIAARVAYSPDGTIIAVDPTYLYDADTFEPLSPRLFPTDWNDAGRDLGTVATRFVQTGDALYLVSERALDTAAVRWRIDIAGLQARTCALADRNFTRSEFDRYRIKNPFGRAPCGVLPNGGG